MGVIYDLPDEVSGDVKCEARRESFVLYTGEDGERIELYYHQVSVIAYFLERLRQDRQPEIDAANKVRDEKRRAEIPHGAAGDGELRPL